MASLLVKFEDRRKPENVILRIGGFIVGAVMERNKKLLKERMKIVGGK